MVRDDGRSSTSRSHPYQCEVGERLSSLTGLVFLFRLYPSDESLGYFLSPSGLDLLLIRMSLERLNSQLKVKTGWRMRVPVKQVSFLANYRADMVG